jgi:hypothetical protein
MIVIVHFIKIHHLIIAAVSKRVDISDTRDVVVAKMALEGVSPTELFPTSSNPLLPVTKVRSSGVRDVVQCSGFKGYTTADPLCRSLITRMRPNMSLEVRRTAVALNPRAIRTGPNIRFTRRPWNSAWDGLHVPGEGSRARTLCGRRCVLVTGANGVRTSIALGTTPFPRVNGRRRDIFIVCLLSTTIAFSILIQIM